MRKTVNLLALAVAGVGLCYTTASAQLSLSWEEVGPNNQGNHVRAIAIDASGNVWAGSVGGGLWKSSDKGSTWSQVTGVSDNLAVSTIATDGNRIFVGTGENVFYEPSNAFISPWGSDSVTTFRSGFFTYTGQPGQGVFVSTDGGATFTHSNATWNSGSTLYSGPFKSIQKIAVKGNRVLVAALDGLYLSDNNLTAVSKASGTTPFTSRPIVDVEFLANNVVLAATKDSVYRSTNNGSSFGPAINSTIFSSGTAPNNRVGGNRIEIAVAPSNNSVVYVTGASDINGNSTGVWMSNDDGATWSRIAPYESATFQPFQGTGKYSIALAVHPTDPYSVVLGGRRTYRYSSATGWITTGSHTFFPGFSTNYIPTPQLTIVPDPTSDSTYFVGTDAEIVRTDNFGTTFSFKTKGFNNAHLHGVDGSVKWEILASDRFGGLFYKDNGNSGPALQQFIDISTRSEGGIARYSPTLIDHIVSQGPDGGLERSLNGGEAFEPFYGPPVLPFDSSIISQDSLYIDGADNSGGGTLYDVGGTPVTPWCFDEYIPSANLADDTLIQNTPASLYMCSKSFVWVCTNPFGDVDSLPRWNRISNDLTRGNVGGGRKEYFTAMACSNDQLHNLWVATNDGRIYRINGASDPATLDVNNDVVRVDDIAMPRRWVTDIAVNPNNSDIVAVTYGSYAAGEGRVWFTNNANDSVPTWRNAHGNLATGLPVYTIAFDNSASSTTVLIGTEAGLYGSTTNYNNTGNSFSWENESGPMGNVQVTDIVFRKYFQDWIDQDNYKYSPDNTVLVATHGRGVFKSRSLVAAPEQAISNSGIEMKSSPNPTTNQATIQITLPAATRVKLQAYDLQGNRVAELGDRTWNTGVHEVNFETSALPAGVYLINAVFSNSKGSYQHTLRQVVVK